MRLLTIDVDTGQTHEYLYQLADGKQNGVNEILAVNDREFLVLERDAKAGDKATAKSLYLDRLDGADRVEPDRGPAAERELPRAFGPSPSNCFSTCSIGNTAWPGRRCRQRSKV